ncbi:MAG: SIMPL domain-containing protein [Pseudanabaena sp. SU_2_4]|nr:SIMPL domain-containing protein [Pseudanabaena sp. SU_2_4]
MESPSVRPNFAIDRFPQLFSGLLSLSLALVVGAWLGSSAIRTLNRSNDVLTVTGSAKKPIRSDYIIWRSSVSGQQPTLPQAYQEIKRHTERVQAYLKEKNVPENAIALTAIETQAIPEVTSMVLKPEKPRHINLRNALKFAPMMWMRSLQLPALVTELINEGIPLESQPPEYLYTQLSQLRVEMIGEATKDAKSRAEAIANNTGGRIGVVRRAETGVFQITSRNSTEVSDSGIYNTSSLEKDITAVVSITFAMEL